MTSCFAWKTPQFLFELLPSLPPGSLTFARPCAPFLGWKYVYPRAADAVAHAFSIFSGSGPPVPAPDLLMQIKQEGELQLQEQQALGVEAWAAGQPDIGEEPWGLSQLDSGAGDVSTDTASGEWLRLRADNGNQM